MSIRTDLAIELYKEDGEGIKTENKSKKEITVTKTEILTESAAVRLGRKIGTYFTIEFPSPDRISDYDEIKEELISALNFLLPQKREKILVIGLGNSDITSDSIGPKTSKRLLATRHIAGSFAERIGLKGLKEVSVIAPDVLGKTGIEITEISEGLISKLKPDAVIVIDALASMSVTRLFKTVQLCNTGISPGSGVKNARKELSAETLGVPVIAVGVPTVVDAVSLAWELTQKEPVSDVDLILSPKDSDLLSNKISELLSEALNVFLQPEIDKEIILSLV